MSLALFSTFCWVVPPPFNTNWLFAKYIQFQFHPFSLYARMSVSLSVRPSGGIQSVIGWYVWLDGFIHSFIGTYSYYSDVLGILECHRNRRQYLCDAITAPSPNGKKNFVRVFVFDAHWKVIHCWMLVGLLWIHIKMYCCQVCKWGGKYFRVPTLYMCNDLMDLERSAWNGTYDDGYGNAEYDRP